MYEKKQYQDKLNSILLSTACTVSTEESKNKRLAIKMS